MRLFASICLSVALLASPASALELRIICPGIVYNAALSELVDDYNKKSGNTAVIVRGVMDKIIGQAKTDTPAADVVGLPGDLMNNLYLDGGIVGATYTPLGRGELGLAVKKGAPKPDISTVAKLAAVLKASARYPRRKNSLAMFPPAWPRETCASGSSPSRRSGGSARSRRSRQRSPSSRRTMPPTSPAKRST